MFIANDESISIIIENDDKHSIIVCDHWSSIKFTIIIISLTRNHLIILTNFIDRHFSNKGTSFWFQTMNIIYTNRIFILLYAHFSIMITDLLCN